MIKDLEMPPMEGEEDYEQEEGGSPLAEFSDDEIKEEALKRGLFEAEVEGEEDLASLEMPMDIMG